MCVIFTKLKNTKSLKCNIIFTKLEVLSLMLRRLYFKFSILLIQ